MKINETTTSQRHHVRRTGNPQYQTFSVHFTMGGRYAKSPKDVVQAEIRFGQ